MHLLSWITLLPLAGAVLVALLRRDDAGLIKGTGIAVALLTFLASLAILGRFDPTSGALQLREFHSVSSHYGLAYDVGVDGISLWLVLLTTFLTPLLLLGAWRSITRNPKLFVASVLVLETAVLGAFTQQNLFFFFLFWEAMLVPMLLIIGIWGSGDRIKSAIKFFLFTGVGSMLMLVAILYLWHEARVQFGYGTFNLSELLRLDLSREQQLWLFAAFALAFAIKVPLFPLHTWLPDAHTDAPTPGSVVLAGVLLKLGTYGLMRFALPLFPVGALMWTPAIVGLAVAGIVYGALVAWVQRDVKKLVAYSSVSHMGFVVLGIFVMETKAATGAVLQMVNHGLSTGALFLLVGMLYERRHTREIEAYGGIAAVTPRLAALFLVATLSSIGLPGLNGFVGEFLILLGSFQRVWGMATDSGRWLYLLPVVVAATGVILGAVYMLTLYLRVFFGPVRHAENRELTDLTWREAVVMAPLVLLFFWIGIAPQGFLARITPTVNDLYERRIIPAYLEEHKTALAPVERAVVDAAWQQSEGEQP